MTSPSSNTTLVNSFMHTEQEFIFINTSCWRAYANLTLKKKRALSNLKNNHFIAMKPCDKCGGICIMNTRDCFTKTHTHLQDQNTYKLLTHNPTSAIANDGRTLIQYMHSQQTIDKVTMEFLLPPKNTRTPLFYGLLKIHKLDCPLHPIVSGHDGPTGYLSAYITHFIQPLARNLPSQIKDTKHILNFIEKLPPLHLLPHKLLTSQNGFCHPRSQTQI